MFDILFRTNEANQSTALAIAVSILSSIFLSFMLVLTYRFTSREVVERRGFTQGMALISVVATMVMQAIGDSLARGLGMLGALSIIRFRTTLGDPRNMAFMFASLGVGIASGVFGFTIAFIGTAAFCTVAFALAARPGTDVEGLTGDLRVNIPADDRAPQTTSVIEGIVAEYARRHRLYEVRFIDPKPIPLDSPQPSQPPQTTQELNFEFSLRRGAIPSALQGRLVALSGVVDHRLRFSRGEEKL